MSASFNAKSQHSGILDEITPTSQQGSVNSTIGLPPPARPSVSSIDACERQINLYIKHNNTNIILYCLFMCIALPCC